MKHTITLKNILLILFINILSGMAVVNAATKQMEYLDRGLVAVKINSGVYLSWRFLGTDDKSVSFNVYRNGTKIN